MELGKENCARERQDTDRDTKKQTTYNNRQQTTDDEEKRSEVVTQHNKVKYKFKYNEL
jgi:hypothetical protein